MISSLETLESVSVDHVQEFGHGVVARRNVWDYHCVSIKGSKDLENALIGIRRDFEPMEVSFPVSAIDNHNPEVARLSHALDFSLV